MRRGRLLTVGFAALATACGLLSGLDDLEVVPDAVSLPDPVRPDATAAADTSRPDVAVPMPDADAGADVDASKPPPCDEPGLLAYWRFDEPSGNMVFDCTTRVVHGVLAGAHRVQARDGGALGFDGGWVGIPNRSALRVNGDITLVAWVRVTPAGLMGTNYVVGKTNNVDMAGYRLGIQGGAASMGVARQTGGVYARGGQVAPLVWTHLAGVFRSGQRLEVYIDGALADAASTNVPNNIRDDGAEPRIGARGDGNNGFDGEIDDVRVYERALSASEIAALAAR